MTETYKYFLIAFHNVLNNMPITQRKVAERSGTAYQTINAIVWDRHTAGPGKQEAIALACGFSLVDFLNKGREIVEHGRDIKPDAGHPQPRYFIAS
ncbi:MAG: helix-turn-helix transcriptional regulator [Desulfocapsaceae bacterium]|nr:helix-turn-helix transcriptional regulator [Desulfocapsaceae bacterium]